MPSFLKADNASTQLLRPLMLAALPLLLSTCVQVVIQNAMTSLLGHWGGPGDLLMLALLQPVLVLGLAFLEASEVCAQVITASRKTDDPWVLPLLRAGCFLALVCILGVMGICLGLGKAGIWSDYPAGFLWVLCASLIALIPAAFNNTQIGGLRGFGRHRLSFVLVISTGLLQLGMCAGGLYLKLGIYALPFAIGLPAIFMACVSDLFLRRDSQLAMKSLPMPIAIRRFSVVAYEVGLPIVLSIATFSLVASFYNRLLLGYGAAAVESLFIAFRIQMMIILPAIALGSALAIHINQCRAKGLELMAKQLLVLGIKVALVAYLLLALSIYLSRVWVAAGFVGNPEVRDVVADYFRYVAISYVVIGPLIALYTIMEQTGFGYRALVLQVLGALWVIYLAKSTLNITGSLQEFFKSIALGNLLLVYLLWQEYQRLCRKLSL